MNQNRFITRERKYEILVPQAVEFQKELAILLSNGRPFVSHNVIIKCHKIVHEMNPLIRRATRDEYRSIKRYYNSFAPQREIILQCIRELIDAGKLNLK